MRHQIFTLCLLLALSGCSDDRANLRPSVPLNQEQVLRGRELVTGLAACGACHGASSDPESAMSGGRDFYDMYGAVKASNLTPAKSGLAAWDVKDVTRAMRARVDREGEKLSPEVHRGYEWMSDRDTLAVVAYLRVLPPVENQVERRSVGFISRNTTGFFEGDVDVRGYVPAIDRKNEMYYGRYLVDHVARCGGCHNGPGSLFSSEAYLSGGRIIKNQSGEKIAPDITGSPITGIGEWSEDALVSYLRTGTTPDHKFVDPAFCPHNFYRNAPEADLRAVARYLRSLSVTSK